MPRTLHNFRDSHQWSNSRNNDLFIPAYQEIFSNVTECEYIHDRELQLRGIDWIVHTKGGRALRIDHKLRKEYYPDILLEHTIRQKDGTRKPGWIVKDLDIDYIAYGVDEKDGVVLLPWDLLRRAWALYGETWKKTYPDKEAYNEDGFYALNTPVPHDELWRGIHRAAIVRIGSSP